MNNSMLKTYSNLIKRIAAGTIDIFLCVSITFVLIYLDGKGWATSSNFKIYLLIILVFLIDSSPIFPGKRLFGLDLYSRKSKPLPLYLKVMRSYLSILTFIPDLLFVPISIVVNGADYRIVDIIFNTHVSTVQATPYKGEGFSVFQNVSFLWASSLAIAGISFFYERNILEGSIFVTVSFLILILFFKRKNFKNKLEVLAREIK